MWEQLKGASQSHNYYIIKYIIKYFNVQKVNMKYFCQYQAINLNHK